MVILSINPYSSSFRNLGDSYNLKNHDIWIRTDVDLDQRIFIVPSASQGVDIWVESYDIGQQRVRYIVCSTI